MLLILVTVCAFIATILLSLVPNDLSQQETIPEPIPEKTIEISTFIYVYDVDLVKSSADVSMSLMIVIPENRGGDELSVDMVDSSSTTINCFVEHQSSTETTYYGQSDRISWNIRGGPELYPFESYYLRFVIPQFVSHWENYRLVMSTDMCAAKFAGIRRPILTKIFESDSTGTLQFSFDNYPVTQPSREGEKQIYFPEVDVHLQRQVTYGTLVLAPVFFAFAFLIFSFLIRVPSKDKTSENLRNRVTIYLSLFAFSMSYFFFSGGAAPQGSVLSFAGILVITLSICLCISGIGTIVSAAFSKNLDPVTLFCCFAVAALVLLTQFPVVETKSPIYIGMILVIIMFDVSLALSVSKTAKILLARPHRKSS